MKAILSMTIVALFSTAMAGCWFYSRPEGAPNAGCQKTTYSVAIASTSTENCAASDATKPPPPPTVPPLPPPSMP